MNRHHLKMLFASAVAGLALQANVAAATPGQETAQEQNTKPPPSFNIWTKKKDGHGGFHFNPEAEVIQLLSSDEKAVPSTLSEQKKSHSLDNE